VNNDRWAEALDILGRAHRPLIALDFDGTLAPFQLDASLSRIDSRGVVALNRLVSVPELMLALVSGRAAADLATVAQVPVGTVLVGDHGAQFGYVDDAGPVLEPVPLTSAQRDGLARFAAALEGFERDGAWIERKPTAVVLHTRPMPSRQLAAQVREEARAVGQRLGAKVRDGKELIELAVIEATKGEAVAKLRTDHRAGIVLYAGDDLTDETVFRTLNRDDVGIRVGPGETAATLRADGTGQIVEFLEALADRLAGR
jgi:trehalose 6-phosphate phosphatase